MALNLSSSTRASVLVASFALKDPVNKTCNGRHEPHHCLILWSFVVHTNLIHLLQIFYYWFVLYRRDVRYSGNVSYKRALQWHFIDLNHCQMNLRCSAFIVLINSSDRRLPYPHLNRNFNNYQAKQSPHQFQFAEPSAKKQVLSPLFFTPSFVIMNISSTPPSPRNTSNNVKGSSSSSLSSSSPSTSYHTAVSTVSNVSSLSDKNKINILEDESISLHAVTNPPDPPAAATSIAVGPSVVVARILPDEYRDYNANKPSTFAVESSTYRRIVTSYLMNLNSIKSSTWGSQRGS